MIHVTKQTPHANVECAAVFFLGARGREKNVRRLGVGEGGEEKGRKGERERERSTVLLGGDSESKT